MLSPCSRLPAPLHLLIQARLASTTSSQGSHTPFPFPKHANPTPHEIFHLPRGASQSAIKSRYYELVRIHHPDCPTARDLPQLTSHSRFQAISNAYAVLSGRRTSRATRNRDSSLEEELLRRKRAHWRASASSDEFGHGGYDGAATAWARADKERWDRGVLVFIVVFALSSTLLPISLLSPFAMNSSDRKHDEARKNLAAARREAREFAETRRAAMTKRREEIEALDASRLNNEDAVVSEQAPSGRPGGNQLSR